MGARLSQPRGPGGTTESSLPTKVPPPPTPAQPWGRRRINYRTLVAPAAALTMAVLLFVYARTSIRAAKANAQRHRQADSGGEGVSLSNESRRRHGAGQRLEDGGTMRQLAGELQKDLFGRKNEKNAQPGPDPKAGESIEEEKLRKLLGKG